MNEHPVAAIVCIMSGVFGGVFLVAFLMAFDARVMAARRVDECAAEQKGRRWVELLLSFTGRRPPGSTGSEYRKVWKELKGVRFLVPLGLALCLLSWLVHRIWPS